MGISVMDGVMLVGSPAESELLATALSPDCGELGPSPFMRESGVERHKIIKSIHLILRKRRSKYDNVEKIKQAWQDFHDSIVNFWSSRLARSLGVALKNTRKSSFVPLDKKFRDMYTSKVTHFKS